MSDHTIIYHTTTLSGPSKRKRTESIQEEPHDADDHHHDHHNRRRLCRQVRFDDQATQIFTTYSSEEYDRGGIFSFPVLYKVNPSILQQQQSTTSSPPKLSLDTQFQSSSSCNEKQSPQTPLEESPTTPPPPGHHLTSNSNTTKRPKLTINTNLTDGPSFLTRLSTTHRHLNEDRNDYLVPLSAYSSPSFLPFF